MNSGPEVRLLNRGAGGRQSCMDTGTLPIVRPGFLKKWTFYSSSHGPAGGRGGQTWPKHPTLLPQQQGLVEGSPERDLRVPIHGGIGGHWGVLWALSSTHGLWIPCSGCQLKHLGKKKNQTKISLLCPSLDASVAPDLRALKSQPAPGTGCHCQTTGIQGIVAISVSPAPAPWLRWPLWDTRAVSGLSRARWVPEEGSGHLAGQCRHPLPMLHSPSFVSPRGDDMTAPLRTSFSPANAASCSMLEEQSPLKARRQQPRAWMPCG